MEPQVLGPLLFSLVVSSLASELLPPPLLGVAPQDEEYYSSSVIFCRDGSKSFARDRLNDGFCDCPDGTDEPGTSACPESRFYCRNIGDAPRFLFSSRVNDHICDCCDGSDEYDGKTSCTNTCMKNGNLLGRLGNFEVGMRKSKINDVQQRRKTIELEDLFQHLKELKIAVMVELLVAASMITCCLFHWRKRLRRRRYSLRN